MVTSLPSPGLYTDTRGSAEMPCTQQQGGTTGRGGQAIRLIKGVKGVGQVVGARVGQQGQRGDEQRELQSSKCTINGQATAKYTGS